MDLVLGPEVRQFTTNYINDLLIASPDLETHFEHLRIVLQKLREAKLTINLEKTFFFRKQVRFLGHILSTDGIRPDPEKVASVRNFPAPTRVSMTDTRVQ